MAGAAAAGGFSTVSSRGARSDGPPQLAGLFSGGMPQLRSSGTGTPAGYSTGTRRTGQHHHLSHTSYIPKENGNVHGDVSALIIHS